MLAMAALAAAMTMSVGCDGSIGTDASSGELGQATFAWDVGLFGCLFGCDAGAPMAERSVARLHVLNPEQLPAFTAASDDPDIAAMEMVDADTIQIEATGTGRTKVVLRDADTGEVVDRFAIDVLSVDEIAPTAEDLYQERFTIAVGGEVQLGISLFHDGERMVGVGGVDYAFDGGIGEQQVTLVEAIADWVLSGLLGTADEYADLEALALGSGSLTVSAPSGAELEVPVDIVDPSVVTRISLAMRSEPVDGRSVIVDARAVTGSETVHAAPCVWALSPADGPVLLDWATDTTAQLRTTEDSRATLSCAIADVSGRLAVEFP